MLGYLLGKVGDTLFGSDVTLDRDDFPAHLTFLSGLVEFIGGGFEHVLSSSVDDDLERQTDDQVRAYQAGGKARSGERATDLGAVDGESGG